MKKHLNGGNLGLMNKTDLRKSMLNKRNSLDAIEKVKKDTEIVKNLLSTIIYKESKNIFIYVSYGSEVDTKKIINIALKENKNIFVPKIKEDLTSMEAIRINSLEDLVEGKYGILEPKTFEDKIDKNKLDAIIMPGAVFDITGSRIGYGGGYYDKYLSDIASKKNKIALAYEFQVVEKLQCEIHDIKVDYIVTDKIKIL